MRYSLFLLFILTKFVFADSTSVLININADGIRDSIKLEAKEEPEYFASEISTLDSVAYLQPRVVYDTLYHIFNKKTITKGYVIREGVSNIILQFDVLLDKDSAENKSNYVLNFNVTENLPIHKAVLYMDKVLLITPQLTPQQTYKLIWSIKSFSGKPALNDEGKNFTVFTYQNEN